MRFIEDNKQFWSLEAISYSGAYIYYWIKKLNYS